MKKKKNKKTLYKEYREAAWKNTEIKAVHYRLKESILKGKIFTVYLC